MSHNSAAEMLDSPPGFPEAHDARADAHDVTTRVRKRSLRLIDRCDACGRFRRNTHASAAKGDGRATDSEMEKRFARAIMGSLAILEEAGRWATIADVLAGSMGSTAEKWADEEAHKKLALIRERLAASNEFEVIHGEGALMVKDHPLNVDTERFSSMSPKEYAAMVAAEGPARYHMRRRGPDGGCGACEGNFVTAHVTAAPNSSNKSG